MIYYASEQIALFFTLKNFIPRRGDPQTFFPRKLGENRTFCGGNSNENKNHISMHRVQTEKLQYNKRQKNSSRPYGN